jgi:hypothetical protein
MRTENEIKTFIKVVDNYKDIREITKDDFNMFSFRSIDIDDEKGILVKHLLEWVLKED